MVGKESQDYGATPSTLQALGAILKKGNFGKQGDQGAEVKRWYEDVSLSIPLCDISSFCRVFSSACPSTWLFVAFCSPSSAGAHPLPCLLGLDSICSFSSFPSHPHHDTAMADTRCSKRLKTSSTDDDGNSSDDQTASAAAAAPRSPACFYSLPEELRSRVLDLAFHLPLSWQSMAGARSRQVDIATTLSLARTSRWLYQRVIFFLYRDIKITRPSALALLQQTVSAHPQLGRVIRSLHVGPEDDTTEGKRSPITVQPRSRDAQGNWRPASYRMSSSLRSPSDVGLLPQWCTPGKEWSFHHEAEDAKALVISRALLAIVESLGLDLDRLHSWQPPMTIAQIYEGQAALDLYLMALGRLDNERSGSEASSSSRSDEANYPHLILVGTAAQPTLTSAMVQDKPYVITRQQVLQHLARPGCVFDTFDHPLLFARSGLETGNVSTTLRRAEPDSYHIWTAEDPADVFTSNGIQDADEPSTKWKTSLDFLDPAFTSIPTTGSLLGLFRSLLALTPGLETLSLTGFLERAVCGSRPIAAVLKNLRALSVGPPPLLTTWHAPLELEGTNRVRQLRICGVMLVGTK